MKKHSILYRNNKTKYINVNMKYDDILKMHNIKTKEEKIYNVILTLKNILYVIGKKGEILETIKAGA